MTIGALLARGLACGLAAGLLAGAFAFLLGEPLVDTAIALEERLAEASGEQHEPGPVGRDGQRAGLFEIGRAHV